MDWGAIPWSVIAPHEAQALKNHDQSPERLAERGGLSVCEAVAVLEDRHWTRLDFKGAGTSLVLAVDAASRKQAQQPLLEALRLLLDAWFCCVECGEPGAKYRRTEGDGAYWLCDSADSDHDDSHYGYETEARPLDHLRALLPTSVPA